MDPKSLPAGIVLPCNRVHIHIDADRDGVVDDSFARNNIWNIGDGHAGGSSGFGAIICVNCDNDDGTASASALENTDLSDNKVNGAADLAEISPLDLRKENGAAAIAPCQVVLSVISGGRDFSKYIRIFDGRTATATEIIGPGTGAEKTFNDSDFDANGRIELGMEAVRFPHANLGSGRPAFDGYIELNLRVETAGVQIYSETAKVRVAPWLMFSHFEETEKVYVAQQKLDGVLEANNNDKYFISALSKILGPKLEVIPAAKAQDDRWVQDVMELGYSSLPAKHDLTSVIRTPSLRHDENLAQYSGRVLLGPDLGYYETNTPKANSSLDSFGNLECSPPIGAAYPFGRIIYGTTGERSGHKEMMVQMREHLEGQALQSPIPLNTGWLEVGHVDEFMSFIPDPSGTHGFKVAFASASDALAIVRRVAKTTPNAPLFDGITTNDGTTFVMPTTVSDTSPYSSYTPFKTVARFLANADIVALQGKVQTILNAQKETLKAGLSLVDSDFVDLPILFTAAKIPDEKDENPLINCIALTPSSVNMLVVTDNARKAKLIIPKPFGPVIGDSGSTSEFENAINKAFEPNKDAELHYIDCFLTYHVMHGEIHCGTNSKRKPPAAKWWQ